MRYEVTMLPVQVGLELHEALEDRVVIASESAQMLTTVVNGIAGVAVVALMAMALSRALGNNPDRRITLPKVDDVLIIKTAVSPEEKLLRRMFGGEAPKEPELTEELMCECGKYRNVRYAGITCDRCGTPVIERKALLLPEGWKVEEGRRWYKGQLGSSSNPDTVTKDIIARAGLKEYEYKWFPPPEEEVKPRVHLYTRTKSIGPYTVVMTRTDSACMVRLYEYLEGWRKKLRATWSGLGRVECDRKFEEVCEVIREVRFETKTALGR